MRCRFIVAVVLLALLTSCTKEPQQGKEQASGAHGHGRPADWKFTLPPGNAADGRKLFVEAECHKCHEVKGETFPAVAKKKGDGGPELAQMAGIHPLEFFAESIINPNAVIDPTGKELGYVGDDGKSKMPDYSNVLTAKQVTDLAAYLAPLKGSEHKTH